MVGAFSEDAEEADAAADAPTEEESAEWGEKFGDQYSGAERVEVQKWSRDNVANSTVDGFLKQAGFEPGTPEFLQARNDVAQHNELRDPNLIHPGQNLWIPKPPAAEEATEGGPAGKDSNAAPAGADVERGDPDGVTAGDADAAPDGGGQAEGDQDVADPGIETADEVTDVADPAGEDSASPDTRLSERETLERLGGNDFRWVADPQNGSFDQSQADINDDLRLFDVAGNDFNREAYMGNLTNSVNRDTEKMYTEEEAAAQADSLQGAARSALADKGLLTSLDRMGEEDGQFSADDIQALGTLYTDDSQKDIATLHQYRDAFAQGYPDGGGEGRIFREGLESIAALGENEDFGKYLSGEHQRDQFLQSLEEDQRALVERMMGQLPEDSQQPFALQTMVDTAGRLTGEGSIYDTLNKIDGSTEEYDPGILTAARSYLTFEDIESSLARQQ